MTRICDECGHTVAKLWRIHRGHGYCGTCYAREFEPAVCPQCGRRMRRHRKETEAVCRVCERNKPCVRCRKPEYRLGRMTPYGPVCASCARYFREPEHCALCGSASFHLTRVKREGHQLRLCPSCARAGHGTCQSCGRHRPLVENSDGKSLCRACAEIGFVLCRSCGEAMPAGHGKRCRQCEARDRLMRRARMNRAALSDPSMQVHFEAFSVWLEREVGPEKAARSLNRHYGFFRDLDVRCGSIPSYPELLKEFGAAKLRRAELPMRWLADAGEIQVDPKLRVDDSERRRINAMVAVFGDAPVLEEILHCYLSSLEEKVQAGSFTWRSARLAMRPAADLLDWARGNGMPVQTTVDAYLQEKPGQRAALSGFVKHLNRTRGTDLSLPPMPDPRTRDRRRRQRLEGEMKKLARAAVAGDFDLLTWIHVALEYFHGVARSSVLGVFGESIRPSRDGYSVIVNDRSYWVPHPAPLEHQSHRVIP